MLRILGFAVAMILGASGVLVGGILIAIGESVVAGWSALLVGLPIAVVAGLQVVRLNRQFQDEQLAAVLRDPSEIVARWHADGREVILARRGLFLGRAFHPFAAAYQALEHIHLSPDGRTLHLAFTNIGADSTLTREVEVPPDALSKIQSFLVAREVASRE